MQKCVLGCTLLSLLLVQALPVATKEEIICPDSNPLNCYPRLFVPTNEWEVVKEGQIIPPGLDIKLDLENMNRQAKLMDANKDINEFENHDLVVANADSNFVSALTFIESFSNSLMSKTSYPVISDNFETVVEWASDRESGVMIAQNIKPFIKISGLYSDVEDGLKFGLTSTQYPKIQEMAYRIMSTAFRNNIEAQKTVLNYLNDPAAFLTNLVKKTGSDSNLVIKRKLGLLSSLLNNAVFEEAALECDIESQLLILYSQVSDNGVKERILIILDDMKLQKRGFETEDSDGQADTVEDLSHDELYSILTQEKLIRSSIGENSNVQELLEGLKDLKLSKRSEIKASAGFLNWLDVQINKAKDENLESRKRDTGEEGLTLDKLIEIRHEVFGNKWGSRRDYIDEL